MVERRGLTFLEGAGEREGDLLVFVLVVEPRCVDLWKTSGENVTQTSRALCGLGFGTFDETNSKLYDSGVQRSGTIPHPHLLPLLVQRTQ